jgi:hypothetical protein
MEEAEAGDDGRPATASAAAMEAKGKAKRDGVVKEVIRLERESVIPILKPKLVMKLAYLIGMVSILPCIDHRRPLISWSGRLIWSDHICFWRRGHWQSQDAGDGFLSLVGCGDVPFLGRSYL